MGVAQDGKERPSKLRGGRHIEIARPLSKYFDSGGWVETIWWKYCPLEAVLSPASDGKKSVGAFIGVAPLVNPAITFKVFSVGAKAVRHLKELTGFMATEWLRRI